MALDNTLQFLSEPMVFAVLEREAMRMLAFAAERREVTIGQILFDQGEPADAAYLLVEGHLHITSERNGERVLDQTIEAGTLLGESALINASHHASLARAATNATVLRIPRTSYRKVLEEFPKSAGELHRRLSERLMALTGDLDTMRGRIDT